MKRTREELSNIVAQTVRSQSEDDLAAVLEDIADSFPDEDYESVIKERDDWRSKAESYRDKYINRFYDNYDKPSAKGYVNGSAPQQEIEDTEEATGYMALFE